MHEGARNSAREQDKCLSSFVAGERGKYVGKGTIWRRNLWFWVARTDIGVLFVCCQLYFCVWRGLKRTLGSSGLKLQHCWLSLSAAEGKQSNREEHKAVMDTTTPQPQSWMTWICTLELDPIQPTVHWYKWGTVFLYICGDLLHFRWCFGERLYFALHYAVEQQSETTLNVLDSESNLI